jgi:hypothetical protein
MVGRTSILPKTAIFLCCFRLKSCKNMLKVAQRTERFRKSDSGRLGLRISTASGFNPEIWRPQRLEKRSVRGATSQITNFPPTKKGGPWPFHDLWDSPISLSVT